VYQLRFRDRKGDAQAGRLSFKLLEEFLELADVAASSLLVVFSFFSFFLLIKSLLCLKVQKTHAALAMEIKNL